MFKCNIEKIVLSCCCKIENNQKCSCEKKITVKKTDIDIAIQSRSQSDFQENIAIYCLPENVQLNSVYIQSSKSYLQQKFKYLHSINLPLRI